MKNVKKKRWQLILGVLLILVGISGLSDSFFLAVAILIFGIYILYRTFSLKKEIPKYGDKEGQVPINIKTNDLSFQVSSAEYFQTERELAFKKSGNINNSIETRFVEVKVDKNNKHDSTALAVYVHGIKIGYIYNSDKDTFNSFNNKARMSVRQFYYNDQYHAELIVHSSENETTQKTLKSVERKKYDYIKARKLVNDITVLDFETTGLSPVQDEIIQIGAIKYRDKLEVDRFSCYIKPLNPIPPRITKITGITNKMVEEAPFIENVLDDLKQFLENETIVAHNASFDMKFLLENFDRHGIDYKRYRVIDTLSLARQQISETPNHKLPTLKKFLNIEAESHDALADCEVTAKLYYYCKQAQE